MTAWLIELALNERAHWLGFVNGKPEWTTDPGKSLRFVRKADADNFKAFWCVTAESTKHMWMDAL